MNVQAVTKPGPLLANKLKEALDLSRNEFHGLDSDQQYRNSFARLLKWDPLGRVTMLGTDQRDQMLPRLTAQVQQLNDKPKASHIFDAGCGDGQTFMLVANQAPDQTRMSFLDPNPYYVERYQAAVEQSNHLQVEQALVLAMDDYSATENNHDLVLAIHSLYFFSSLTKTFAELYASLTPGGSIFIVFADESQSYTGHCVRSYHKHTGNTQALENHKAVCNERLALLTNTDTPAKLIDTLNKAFPQFECAINSEIQATRLFGNSFHDLLAMCNLTDLCAIDDAEKFNVCAALIEGSPETIGLRVEQQGVRAGMLSVLQQQVVVSITKSPR